MCRCHEIWVPKLSGTLWAPRARNGAALPFISAEFENYGSWFWQENLKQRFGERKILCSKLLGRPKKFSDLKLILVKEAVWLWTGLHCEQGYVVNRVSLWTGLRCEQGYVVNRVTLWTGLRCEQGYVVNRVTLWTGLHCEQGYVVNRVT